MIPLVRLRESLRGLWQRAMKPAMFYLWLTIAGISLCLVIVTITDPPRDNFVRFAVFDVGQGSSALIETPLGYEVLVDTGRNRGGLGTINSVRDLWDTTIDFVVATHPDSDHIGLLPDILERYEVDAVITTNKAADNGVYDSYLEQSVQSIVPTRYVSAGDQIAFGDGVSISVLYPYERDVIDYSTNDSSLVFQIHHGESTVLVTGDASSVVERQLVARYGEKLNSDILLVGHHGSKNSSDPEFIKTVNPRYAVISSGVENRYGHPHPRVINTLQSVGAMVLRTDTIGTMQFLISTSSVLLVQ